MKVGAKVLISKRASISECNLYFVLYPDLADSFQEVELGLPPFSDDNIDNGEDLEGETSSFLKCKVGEEQSEPKTNGKSDASVSL